MEIELIKEADMQKHKGYIYKEYRKMVRPLLRFLLKSIPKSKDGVVRVRLY